MSSRDLWKRFKTCLNVNESVGVIVDISRMNFPDSFFAEMEGPLHKAFAQMAALEAGAIANPDEHRMVGHYWLRDSALAPDPTIRQAIDETLVAIKQFAKDVHAGTVRTEKGGLFKNLLVVGIGGSVLGPQFVAHALTTSQDKMKVWFIDNTDPDGIDQVLAQIAGSPGGNGLSETLTVVTSKSGGTKETRNGQLEVKEATDGPASPSSAMPSR